MAASVLEPHGPVGVLARVHALLDEVTISSYRGLSAGEQREVAGLLARLKARAAAHELAAVRAVAESGVARREGASSTGALLSGDFGGDRRDVDRAVKQAEAIGKTPLTHEAMAGGKITSRQARLIEKALEQLPDQTPSAVREACETQLVDDAPRFDIKRLQRQADRIVADYMTESDDEDALDAAENDLVEQREQRAWRAAEFWMGPAVDGRVQGGFTIPEAQAAQLRIAMDALCAPQVEIAAPGAAGRATGEVLLDERPSYRTRQGWAFTHLCELLPTDRLPETNSLGPVLTVNLDHETLVDGLKVATLTTGETLSAGQARRMACEHRLLPAVFGGDSLPLDLGRTRRLFTLHQRRALEMRDGGCVFPGCDRPPGWTVVHHANERWADGGSTDLSDGVLLCPQHHRILHSDGWGIRFAPDGIPELIPPAVLDPSRTPRRHPRFEPARL